ncbi:glycosyltransferase [Actinobacillus indolicus]|uniref:Glycosyltransferase n=1 Tax=Actinobacillus indolicus TaxID=51049 RepID=A0A4P7CJQ0_9PAST|nr:CDP-glycerol glycerophosphotransferase family protein [Actinobacillus indolicus]QBQ63517.1 glycosyltransferase [Actinobacillus indolicus]
MKIVKNLYHHIVAPKEYHQGLVLYKRKKWHQALLAFERAYKQAPNHAKNVFKLGLCHLKLGQYPEAQMYISKAIELAPYNTSWRKQLEQSYRKLNNSGALAGIKEFPIVPRISHSALFFNRNKKTLLLIPSDYNHRVMADISSFIPFYQEQFDIYIILRDLEQDIIKHQSHTLVKQGTSFGEFLKFTADYVIDSGTMNYSYRITDTNKWVSVWHGIPYKKMFVDLNIEHLSTAIRYNLAYDAMISMSDFYTNTFLRKAMRYDGEILQLGCAKMDNLLKQNSPKANNNEVRKILISQLGLPENKKFVLYAPTYRASSAKCPFDKQKLLTILGKEYHLIYITSETYPAEKGVNYLPHLSNIEALLLSDILISDYNPLIYQFDRYNRPVVLIQTDREDFMRANPARKEELNVLASRYYVANSSEEFYSLDWGVLKQEGIGNALPKNIGISDLRYKLGIPVNKKVILYAPTYREAGAVTLPFNPKKLLKKLNNEYVIITKMHYLNYLEKSYDNVVDCTSYSDMADLMKMADILISDYSSLVLDYAILNKPIVLFQYDYEEYMQQRGVYFDFNDYLTSSQIIKQEQELYKLDWLKLESNNHKIIETFYPLEDGNSTQRIVDAINFNPENRQSKDIIFLVNDLNQIGGVHTFLKNMAKYYKQKYNSRIFVIAIKEFAIANSEYHLLESPYIDFKLSSQYLAGACTNILQNTDGLVISLQFSAHMHFQKYLTNAKSVLMFHGDVKDMISKEMYSWHLDALNENKIFNYEKLLLLTESAVTLLKPHLIPEIQDKLGFMHNSIDAEFMPIAYKNTFATAVISRLDADKNIFAIIDLGKAILDKKANIIVNVYGDGALKDDFMAEIEKYQLQDIIKLKGFESDKAKIFAENDSLLLMSKSEGFGLVILEAYAYGKPAIVFDSFTAAKDVVEDKKSGFLLPYGDYEGVIHAVHQCGTLTSGEIQAKFYQFSNETVFKQWNQLITELDEKQTEAELGEE